MSRHARRQRNSISIFNTATTVVMFPRRKHKYQMMKRFRKLAYGSFGVDDVVDSRHTTGVNDTHQNSKHHIFGAQARLHADIEDSDTSGRYPKSLYRGSTTSRRIGNHRLSRLRRISKHSRSLHRTAQASYPKPPAPPVELTPLVACNQQTNREILWHIAKTAPELRHWLIANPNADAELLEFISQSGGPQVKLGFDVLFASHEHSRQTSPSIDD